MQHVHIEKYLKKLKGAKLGIVSIDGLGTVDEYVLPGTKWDEKVQVIDYTKSILI